MIIMNYFSKMAISQLHVSEFEWNKVHFEADKITLKMNTNLNSDYISFFPGDKKSGCMVFLDTVCN